MNSQKVIEGKTIMGPLFSLRGITTDRINTRHAFLIYVTYKIKYGLRNLEEEIKIDTICQIKEEVEEAINSVNTVDYDCIGNANNHNLNNDYELIKIEGNNENDKYITGNWDKLDYILKHTNVSKTKSEYSYEDSDKIIVFKTKNITVYPNNIFSISGNLNKAIPNVRKLSKNINLFRMISSEIDENIQIELNIEPKKSNCTFYSDNKTLIANLTCQLEFKNGTNITNLRFINNEIKVRNSYIYMTNLSNRIIDLNYNEFIVHIKPKKKESSSSKKTIIIVFSIIAGVILLSVLTISIVYIIKMKKANKMKITNNNKIADQQINDSNKSDIHLDKDQ